MEGGGEGDGGGERGGNTRQEREGISGGGAETKERRPKHGRRGEQVELAPVAWSSNHVIASCEVRISRVGSELDIKLRAVLNGTLFLSVTLYAGCVNIRTKTPFKIYAQSTDSPCKLHIMIYTQS